MRFPKPTLLTRDDTLLGVCEALGRDFGFNPFLLRAALAAALLWNPAIVIGGYLAAAVVIGLIRIALPDPAQSEATAAEPAPVEAVRADPEPQPLAA